MMQLPTSLPSPMRFTAKKKKDNLLMFGQGNAKLHVSIATFSLPAGHTCPFAKECLSKAERITGKMIDGKHCRFRCFAASQECTYRTVRNARWRNYDLLRKAGSVKKMGELIHKSLPPQSSAVRIHVSGDYYTESYFLAWLNVAYNNPMMNFYGYTKATPFVVKYRNALPPNFRMTASKGGTCDSLISKFQLKSAEVVFSEKEAKEKGLKIDHDDSLAFGGIDSFALLLHGTQRPNSEAGRAWRKLIKSGVGGYGKGNRKNITKSKFEIVVPLNGKSVPPVTSSPTTPHSMLVNIGISPTTNIPKRPLFNLSATNAVKYIQTLKSRYAAK